MPVWKSGIRNTVTGSSSDFQQHLGEVRMCTWQNGLTMTVFVAIGLDNSVTWMELSLRAILVAVLGMHL